MSIYKYEEAIILRMRKLTGDDRIIITPSDNINNVIPRIKNDELKLPLIFMTRNSWGLANSRPHGLKMNGHINNNFPLMKEPTPINEYGKIKRLQVIPIIFNHTFTVLSKTREENDNIIRELIWLFAIDPTFEINVPYTLNIPHVFTLSILNDITDASPISSHSDIGEYFSQSFTTTCNDAYLWKSSEHYPTRICIDGKINNEHYITKQSSCSNINYNSILE